MHVIMHVVLVPDWKRLYGAAGVCHLRDDGSSTLLLVFLFLLLLLCYRCFFYLYYPGPSRSSRCLCTCRRQRGGDDETQKIEIQEPKRVVPYGRKVEVLRDNSGYFVLVFV